MSTVSFTTATQHLDTRMLRDIGVEADGAVIDSRDPRYRPVSRRARLVDRLLAALTLSGTTLIRA
jgi:hypothetical protein